MDSRQQLAEAVRLLKSIASLAASPARLDAARLSAEAEPARNRRKSAIERLKRSRQFFSRFGWLPFLRSRLIKAVIQSENDMKSAETAWRGIKIRAGHAADTLKNSQIALGRLKQVQSRLKEDGAMPISLEERTEELFRRVRFLKDSHGRDASRASEAMDKVLSLSQEALNIVQAWHSFDTLGHIPQQQSKRPQGDGTSITYGTGKGKRTQLALDFSGNGIVDEQRIWLPVTPSRTKEMIERGARIDRDANKRGSQLWIPVSERSKLDSFLPLAFRQTPTRFSFPPIRHNAVGQNLWSVFDQSSWNHIRTAAYDRAGHRCQICGKQGGSLWNRITPKEERLKSGLVDCHEVWDWQPLGADQSVGIQKLNRILVLCKDCHMAHHEGFAMMKAREAGVADQAADYIKSLRMLMNRCDGPTLEAQLADDRAAWESAKSVDKWVLDLSHLAAQDYMADHTLVLKDGNRAGVGPEQIGGISFMTEDGTSFAAIEAKNLARGEPPRPLARPVQSEFQYQQRLI